MDVALFRFINSSLQNPFFDRLMPIASDTPFFQPLVLILGILLICKGGARGRLCAVFVLLSLLVGDSFISSTLKHAVDRPRPYETLASVHLLVGKGSHGSMPSSHALNWFAGAMVALVYYRRSWRFMVPLASLVAFSRVYNGVHYPSDVLTGAVLGAGTAAWLIWTAEWLWQWVGPKWLRSWWERVPSLLNPGAVRPVSAPRADDGQWLQLGYLLIGALLVARVIYLAAGKIELSEDEAYQWLWSKHLALSYYSKPLLIACAQWLGTHLFGDTAFGVRILSPVISAAISLLVLRFFARERSAREGVALILVFTAMPMFAVGSTLMTIDPLSVLFWVASMVWGWRAIQPGGTTRDWVMVGICQGLGSLSKYTNLFQWICWLVVFVLIPSARGQARRPGPWLALVVNLVFLLPVLIWNQQHGWITVEHVASDGRLNEPAHFTLRYFWDFLGAESGILNPIFFWAMVVAAWAFWWGRSGVGPGSRVGARGLPAFLFAMGAPLFLFYLLFSFHSRIYPNWIAPSVVPLFALMVIFWSRFWAERRWVRNGFYFAMGLGLVVVVILHDTNLTGKIFHRTLPPAVDPLRRVRGWRETADVVEEERARLGREAFVIGDHYGIVGELSFYSAAAREAVRRGEPLVYFRRTSHPENQFYFWPDYGARRGQNAVYVQQASPPRLAPGWAGRWLWEGSNDLYLPADAALPGVPESVRKEFKSVLSRGTRDVTVRGQVVRRLQIFECRELQ